MIVMNCIDRYAQGGQVPCGIGPQELSRTEFSEVAKFVCTFYSHNLYTDILEVDLVANCN